MKKIISTISFAITVAVASITFASTTFTASLTGNRDVLKAGDEIEVALKLENFTENEKGINVLIATIDYDKAIFKNIVDGDITSIQYWDKPSYNQVSGKIATDSYTFVDKSHNALKIRLRVNDEISETIVTEIKLKNIEASDGNVDINVDDAVLKVQVEKSSKVEKNGSESKDNKVIYMVAIIVAIVVAGSVAIVFVKKRK